MHGLLPEDELKKKAAGVAEAYGTTVGTSSANLLKPQEIRWVWAGEVGGQVCGFVDKGWSMKGWEPPPLPADAAGGPVGRLRGWTGRTGWAGRICAFVSVRATMYLGCSCSPQSLPTAQTALPRTLPACLPACALACLPARLGCLPSTLIAAHPLACPLWPGCSDMVARVQEEFGRLDILVNK